MVSLKNKFPKNYKIRIRNCPKNIFGEILGNVKGAKNESNILQRCCTKKRLNKSESVVKLYDELQLAYASILEANEDIKEIRCNVLIDPVDGSDFTSDFVCVKTNGDIMVRECVYRKKLSLPRTAKLLDASRNYWANHVVLDWGLVIEKEVQ